jgi:hypothetical protein
MKKYFVGLICLLSLVGLFYGSKIVIDELNKEDSGILTLLSSNQSINKVIEKNKDFYSYQKKPDNKKSTSNVKTTKTSTVGTQKEVKNDYISKNPTNYMLYENINTNEVDDIVSHFENGNFKYVATNHPEISNIIKLVDGYAAASTNLDYKTFTGREAFAFFYDSEVDVSDLEKRIKMMNDRKYIIKLNNVENIKIKFTNHFAYVEYGVNYSFSSNGSDFETATSFVKLVLFKHNNVWKIVTLV